jgi:type II secretory pathway predicted ATPase ExeA
MYWEYFNLKSNPFGITPDPRYLYLSTAHASAIEWIRFAIEQHEYGLITGEVGSGKTVLSRYLVDNLKEEEYKICWIINQSLSPTQLLREIYLQLFEKKAPHSKSELVKVLQEGLAELYLNNKFPVVIIDEAQAISSSRVFEELRLLGNYQTDEQNLLSIIILGQPELAKKIKRKNYRAFLQRIRFTITLNPLTIDEIDSYIQHRLNVAGSDGSKIFMPDSIETIFELSKGYPRPLNHLASFSMMEAMTRDKMIIDSDTVKSAARSILYFEDMVDLNKHSETTLVENP